MSVAEGKFCGVRLATSFRVSFTGELGFEVNVPADFGADVFRHLGARAVARRLPLWHRDHARSARRKGYTSSSVRTPTAR